MNARIAFCLAILALAWGGVALRRSGDVSKAATPPNRSATRGPLESTEADRAWEEEHLCGLEPRLKPVVADLHRFLQKYFSDHSRQFETKQWYKDAAARLHGVPAADLKTILAWAQTQPEAEWFLAPAYLHPLFQQLAFTDPDFCRATLLGENSAADHLSSFLTIRIWPAYYLGLSQCNPMEALRIFKADSFDARLPEYLKYTSPFFDLCVAASAADPEALLKDLLKCPSNNHLTLEFEAYCWNAPAGKDWSALADEIVALASENEKTHAQPSIIPPSDLIDSAAAMRWMRENPRAALDWYAGRAPEDEMAQNEDTLRTARKVELINGLAGATFAPNAGEAAETVLNYLIRSGSPGDLQLAERCLGELTSRRSDSRWLTLIATLPDADSRTAIFLSSVSHVTPRVRATNAAASTEDPFAGALETLPEDNSPNPDVVVLRPSIVKMHLSPENALQAGALLQAVEDREAARRRGEPDPPPTDLDDFTDPFGSGK